jgi:hypothetical protein
VKVSEIDHQSVMRICNGNAKAAEWINIGRIYVHLIDDIIDEDLDGGHRARGAERICGMGACAIKLYSHDFYIENRERLSTLMTLITGLYATSVRYEGSDVEWKKNFSDWSRHSWLLVVLSVADICGGLRGYENMRNISDELWEQSFVEHHDHSGERH